MEDSSIQVIITDNAIHDEHMNIYAGKYFLSVLLIGLVSSQFSHNNVKHRIQNRDAFVHLSE
jgi:hypothetical protein